MIDSLTGRLSESLGLVSVLRVQVAHLRTRLLDTWRWVSAGGSAATNLQDLKDHVSVFTDESFERQYPADQYLL